MKHAFLKRGNFAFPFFCVTLGVWGCQSPQNPQLDSAKPQVLLESLAELSVEALRARHYSSNITVEDLTGNSCIGTTPRASLPEAGAPYKSYMASFKSDGLLQYARVTIPDTAPESGHPFVLFLHGYVGAQKAPGYSIGCNPNNLYYSELTDAFARSGFAVLAPGYRGHGSVNAVPAQGIEYLTTFDQGAGLSTQFYAIDALNFAAGIQSIAGEKFPDSDFKFDKKRFFLVGHSQGGDAGLTYLAVVGEGKHKALEPAKAALWSGTFLDRLTALETMMPVALTPQAFLSGDGTWNGTATSDDGQVNPNFIFGFPPDWIEDPNPKNWTWQTKTWSEPDVKSAVNKVTSKMYQDLSRGVGGLSDIEFEMKEGAGAHTLVTHDPRIAEVFPKIGGYNFEEFLQEPLTLHVPQKDYYSQISWNKDLCDRINASQNGRGESCKLVVYPHNNHSMRASAHGWFSPPGTPDGYPFMMDRLVKEFSEQLEARP